MRIALGSDHNGVDLKQSIADLLEELGHEYQDLGCYDTNPVDYPDIAKEVALAVGEGLFDQGVLICGTGIGMSIAANKISGVRAALCHDLLTAQRAREHNNSNILCMGGDVVEGVLALAIVTAYLEGQFEGGRHARRVGLVAGQAARRQRMTETK